MRNFTKLIIVSLVIVAGLSAVAVRLRHSSNGATPQKDRLVVHEWGTFTSIAGKDGVALEWRPLSGPSDLPKFVHSTANLNTGLRHVNSKIELTAAVRMETPVIYFYSNREMNVSTKVDFPKGKITEWYPLARAVDNGIDWGKMKVQPGAPFNLPADYSDNHYYAARETDAAPLQVCATNGHATEQEKFLFYRGVGNFDLPLAVTLDNNRVTVRNTTKNPIAQLIVFESREGKIGFQTIDNLSGTTTIDRPSLNQSTDAVIERLRQALVTAGLYDKEADAMIKTWRNSWFEAGMRVFYILPRPATDAVLPITIDPRPDELVRVLVGRTEVITPEMEKPVREQASLLSDPSPAVRSAAAASIKKYGRFSEPILKRMLDDESDAALRARIKRLIETSASE
ncbi:MAG TPA: HEAT repeat domain-containing protein [Pyrinomonadaceae bacterium]|jgi:hypothetical protein|nr:HEAT repeat domain-containing protein [Pyrinomonadaceae bacterium]